MEIQNTNGKYLIYDDGKIFSNQSNRFIKPYIMNKGYCMIRLYDKKVLKRYTIHRLVALHYLPNPNNLPQVDHIDRDKTNNNVNNLRWVDNSENQVNKPNYGKIPYRHIYLFNNMSWTIQIRRDRKSLFTKRYTITKYTLEEVVRFRNEKYIELGIEIDDN